TTEGLPDETKAWTHESMARYTQMRNQLVFVNDPKEVAARYPSHTSINGRTIEPMAFYNFFSTQPWVNPRPGQLILKAANHADLQRFYNENIQAFALRTQPLNEQTWAEFLATLDNSLKANKWEEDTRAILREEGVIK